MKTCTGCRIEKPDSEFYIRADRTTRGRGLASTCKVCQRAQSRAYVAKTGYKTDPQKAREAGLRYSHKYPLKVRDKWYRRRYGFTLQEFQEQLEKQNNKCAICQLEPARYKDNRVGWHIDHDHTTGKIRAILCFSCNLTVGSCKENVRRLQRCIAYLRFHHKLVKYPVEARWCGVPQGGFEDKLVKNRKPRKPEAEFLSEYGK